MLRSALLGVLMWKAGGPFDVAGAFSSDVHFFMDTIFYWLHDSTDCHLWQVIHSALGGWDMF